MSIKHLFAMLCALLFLSVSYESLAQTESVVKQPRYEEANMEGLSRLYWRLNRLQLNNDDHIDNFLLINKCDIYKDYIYNEFEWQTIRERARLYLADNKDKFSTRMEFLQALRLGSYDFEKESFELLDDYKIDSIRRFEIFSTDYSQDICGKQFKYRIEGYEKGVFVELTRPIMMTHLPMRTDKAQKYITEKTIAFKKMPIHRRKKSTIFSFRDIYLVMKVKFFASNGIHAPAREQIKFAKVIGVLEGIEVYDDLNRTRLLYKEDYRKTRKKKKKTAQEISPDVIEKNKGDKKSP